MLICNKKASTSRQSDVFDKKTSNPQINWPGSLERAEVKWFPASTRLIELVRANTDKFVLPPAVVRKASWRE